MLRGIRIVEIEALGPAPFAGMLLADLGADVIVVHRKLASMPGAPKRSLLDRGKRSIALDLKDAGDVAVLMRLIATANGLIEGFRPGVMERLGLGPDACLADNSRLVYGRMTGWGQDGPLASAAGHDMNYVGVSGALWYASLPGEPPMAPPTLVGDIGGGALYLAIGMLAGIMNARAGSEWGLAVLDNVTPAACPRRRTVSRSHRAGLMAGSRLFPAVVIVDLVYRERVRSCPVVGTGPGSRREQLLVVIARAAEQEVDEIVIGRNVAFLFGLLIMTVPGPRECRRGHAAAHCESKSADR